MIFNPIPSNLNQSVWDACGIIKYLTGKDWCRLKDISQDLNIEQAKTHRLLSTLVYHDFVQYNEDTHQYRLGLQFYTIAYRMSQDSVVSVAKPFLEKAAGALFETVNFGMLAHDKAKLVHVYRLDGSLSANYDDIPLGVSRFINESALGKAILANMPFGEQQAVMNRLEFRQYTDKSILSKEALQQDLFRIVERGYAVDDEEVAPGCYCVAMPVYDATERAIAAVSIALIGKPSDKRLAQVLRVLKITTEQITEKLKS